MEISPVVLDGVRELITIGVGRAAGMLNQLTGAHVSLHVPDVHIHETTSDNADGNLSKESSSQVSLHYTGLLTGSTVLVIPHSSALNLVTIMTGEDQTLAEMDALRIETLLEVGNIIISALMSSLASHMDTRFSFRFPIYHDGTIDTLILDALFCQFETRIDAGITFEVQNKRIEGALVILLTTGSFDLLTTRMFTMMREYR
jgi:chemotaxis protein CheC